MASSIAEELVDILKAVYADPFELEHWLTSDGVFADGPDVSLAALRLSHTRRFVADEIAYYHLLDTYGAIPSFRAKIRAAFPSGLSYPGIGILADHDAEGRAFVAVVANGGAAAKAGILPGDELITVGDRPYSEVAAFRGREGRPTPMSIRRRRGGAPVRLSLTPVVLRPGRQLAAATRSSAREIDLGGRSYGYIRPWSLAGDRHWRIFAGVLAERFAACSGLILDLRRGVGGVSPAHADFFIGRSPELQVRGRDKSPPLIVNARWRKPVVAIVDQSTQSGSEVLAFALQRAGIPLVGTRTAGRVSNAKPYLLSDGSFLTVAVGRVEVDGETLEGRGVSPDVEIVFDPHFSAGGDPTIATAARLLAG